MICRAKSLLTHEFVEGGFVQGKNAWIVQIDDEGNFRHILVDPETVGRFTGITDKNGTKIFEGDIISIRFEDDSIHESDTIEWYESAKVFFSTEYHGWYAVYANGDEIYMHEYDDEEGVAVIGNIHDNPELLKEV